MHHDPMHRSQCDSRRYEADLAETVLPLERVAEAQAPGGRRHTGKIVRAFCRHAVAVAQVTWPRAPKRRR